MRRFALLLVLGGVVLPAVVVPVGAAAQDSPPAQEDFAWEPNPPAANEEVTFTARSDIAEDCYQWDFTGDGQVDKEGRQVTHTFPQRGDYTVTLRASEGGCESELADVVTHTVSVTDGLPAGCSRKQKFFDVLEVKAQKICRAGAKVLIEGEVDFNYFKLVPVDRERTIEISPADRSIKSNGRYRLVTTIQYLGPITWWAGRIDWNLSNAGRRAGASQTGAQPRRALLARLTVGQGTAQLNVPDLQRVDRGAIGQLPFTGTVDVYLNERAEAIFEAQAALPGILRGFTGQVTLTTDPATQQIKAGAIKVQVPNVRLGPVGIENAFILWQHPDIFGGGAKVSIPFPGRNVSLDGAFEWKTGPPFEVRHVKAEVAGLNIPIGPVLLQDIGFDYRSAPPPQHLGGNLKVLVAGIVGIRGGFKYTWPHNSAPGVLEIQADGDIRGVRIVTVNAVYRTNGAFDFNGRLAWQFGPFGLDAGVAGFFHPTGWEIEGGAKVFVSGPFGIRLELGGTVLVSSNGFAACGRILGGEVGFGVLWQGGFNAFVGCDLAPYRARRSMARAAGTSQTFTIRPNTQLTSFAFEGQDAPPKVTLVGPNGERISSAEPPLDTTVEPTDKFLVGEDAAKKTTFIALGQPAAGKWTLEVAADSSSVVDVKQADKLPEPSVTARVTGRGRNRVLRYRVKPIAGQRVTFAEDGPDTGKVIGTAKGASGVIRFRPMDGARGTRRIRAIVTQAGLVRETLRVAEYKAPPPIRPSRVGPIVVRRRGTTVTAMWRPARDASAYSVRVAVGDGRRLLFEPGANSRRVVVPDVFPTERVTFTVRGFYKPTHRFGLPRTAQAKKRGRR